MRLGKDADFFMNEQERLNLRYYEDGFIGDLLRNPELLPCVVNRIKADDMYNPDSYVAYRAILLMYRAGLEINSMSVGDYTEDNNLDPQGLLQPDIHLYYSDRVFAEIQTSRASFDYYVDKIEEYALRRHMMRSLDVLYQLYKDYAIELDDVKSRCMEKIAALHRKKVDDSSHAVRESGMMEMLNRDYIPTDMEPLDDLISGGLWRKYLYILAARPSMGKTTFAINLMMRMLDRGCKVLFFSFEVADTSVYYKMAGMKSGVNFIEVRRLASSGEGYAHDPEMAKKVDSFMDAYGSLDYNLWIRRERELSTLYSIALEKSILHDGLDLIVIDHINLMTVKGMDNTTERLTAISGRLKELAISLNVPVLALSQLNRDLTKRDNKRPMLNDLRGSGSLEQDADVVLLLHRDAYYETGDDIDESNRMDMDIIAAKQRDGLTGKITVKFDRTTGRIGYSRKDPANIFKGQTLSKKATEAVEDIFN